MAGYTKKIRERVTRMNNAWKQGAPNATFKNITQPQFQTRIDAAAAIDQVIDDLEAQLTMKKQERDAAYQELNAVSIEVRDGVEGHPDYGRNHPLYEGMGFITDDKRQSGLTRKKSTPSGGKS